MKIIDALKYPTLFLKADAGKKSSSSSPERDTEDYF